MVKVFRQRFQKMSKCLSFRQPGLNLQNLLQTRIGSVWWDGSILKILKFRNRGKNRDIYFPGGGVNDTYTKNTYIRLELDEMFMFVKF